MPRSAVANDSRREAKRSFSATPGRRGKDSHLAYTLDVSNHGVNLGGCRAEMKVGDKIESLPPKERTIPHSLDHCWRGLGAANRCLVFGTGKAGLGRAVF
jgi:hypothetical protein